MSRNLKNEGEHVLNRDQSAPCLLSFRFSISIMFGHALKRRITDRKPAFSILVSDRVRSGLRTQSFQVLVPLGLAKSKFVISASGTLGTYPGLIHFRFWYPEDPQRLPVKSFQLLVPWGLARTQLFPLLAPWGLARIQSVPVTRIYFKLTRTRLSPNQ